MKMVNGWKTRPHEIHRPLNYPGIGPKESYLIYHEELESLVKNFPTINKARFWMTFSEQYLNYLHVIQDIGMAGIEPVNFQGREVIPVQFLKAVLPNPAELGKGYKGETSIGCRIKGLCKRAEKTYYIYNNCSHEEAYRDTGMQAVSFTTGVPAMLGAMMFLKGFWRKPGVFNVEEFDPDPFMELLPRYGLSWHEQHNIDLEV